MPGGGQDAEELLPEAACREVVEELGLQVDVKDLAFVIEGLHGEKFHRVDLVFYVSIKVKLTMLLCKQIRIKWAMIGWTLRP